MYSVEVQMLCCSALCIDGLECNQLFSSKEEAKDHLQAMKRHIRAESCCSLPLMMIEEYSPRNENFTLTVLTRQEKSLTPLP